VLLGSFVLVLWGFVSLRWVDAARLAETTIPYTVAARAILGQEGRIIMGIVIISGVAGAVNSLFGGVSRMIAGMSEAGLAPAFLGKTRFGGRVPVLLLGAATAAMLLSGMAGSDHLNGFLRGALILWLMHYAVLHSAAFLSGRRDDSSPLRRMANLLGALILALAALGLWVLGEERQVMAVFMFIVVGAVLILGLLWTGLARNRDQGR
jgi:L-asparagine transporter-like permease